MTVASDVPADPTGPAPAEVSSRPAAPRRRSGLRLPPWVGAFVVTGLLVLVTWHFEPKFIKPDNLINIVRNQSPVGILAVGMTLVIVAGGIDLSVGSLLVLAGGMGLVVLDKVLGHFAPPGVEAGDVVPTVFHDVLAVVLAGATTLAVGLAAGWVNGILVAKGRLPAFIVTLAALLAFRSGAQCLADGGQFHPAHKSPALAAIGRGWPVPHTDTYGGNPRRPHEPVPMRVPYESVVWAAVAAAGIVVLTRTRLGRYAVAVGTNPRAARYSAVPVARVRVAVFALSGLLAAVAAFLLAARNAAISSGNDAVNFELYAIAAAVIGGAKMSGGVGSVLGSVIGALLLGAIDDVIVYLNVNSQAHGIVIGGIIVVAALAQRGPRAE